MKQIQRLNDKYGKDHRKFYYDGGYKGIADLLYILADKYCDSSFGKIEAWLDFAKVGDSSKLTKIDRVIVRVI